MKSINEVIEFTKVEGAKALFNFYVDPLTEFMSLEVANSSGLFKDLSEEDWAHTVKEYNRDNVLMSMKDYLPFAFEKAREERGLSASRSIQKMRTYLFMLNDIELCSEIEDYTDYGLPQLEKISTKYFSGEVK